MKKLTKMNKNNFFDKIKKTKFLLVLLLIPVLLSGCNKSLLETLFGTDPTQVSPASLIQSIENVSVILRNGILGVIIIFFLWGGIQYLTSFGESEKMEKAKKTIFWAVIGAIVVLLASQVLRSGIGLIYKAP